MRHLQLKKENGDYIDMQLDAVSRMLIRWSGGRIIKHVDVELLERLIHERNAMDKHIMEQQDLINVLMAKRIVDGVILEHFDVEDIKFLRNRIAKRQLEVLSDETTDETTI